VNFIILEGHIIENRTMPFRCLIQMQLGTTLHHVILFLRLYATTTTPSLQLFRCHKHSLSPPENSHDPVSLSCVQTALLVHHKFMFLVGVWVCISIIPFFQIVYVSQ
jgi:hypothetical protein